MPRPGSLKTKGRRRGLRIHDCEPGRDPDRENARTVRRLTQRSLRLATMPALQQRCRRAELTKRIAACHEHSDAPLGAPRIHAELADAVTRLGRKRVERLVKQAGVAGVTGRHSALGYKSPIDAIGGRPALADLGVSDGRFRMMTSDHAAVHLSQLRPLGHAAIVGKWASCVEGAARRGLQR